MRTITLFASGLVAVGLCACSGASSEPEPTSIEDGYTVQPTGGAALLVVTAPAGASIVPTVTARRDQQAVMPITLGTPAPLTPGSYCIRVSLPLGTTPHVAERCDIPVRIGGATTFPLGGFFTTTRVSSAKVLGVDVPFVPLSSHGSADPALPLLLAPGLVPYPAGALELGPWFSGTIADGEEKGIELDSPSGRHALEILPPNPASRTLPDVPAALGIAFGTYNDYSTARTYALTARVARVETRLFYATHGATSYGPRLGVYGPGWQFGFETRYETGLRWNTAQPGAPLASYRLGRLDVADVSVTMADGTKRTVRGTFSATFAGLTTLVSGAPTGHGVDVPVGACSVRVAYTSPVDGTTMYYDEAITITP